MSNDALFGPDQVCSLEPVATWLYTEGRRLGDAAALIEGLGAQLAAALAACRTWGVESENRPQRGQFLPHSPPHSPAMGQEGGEKWTAAVDLQPMIPKSDRLLDHEEKRLPIQGRLMEAEKRSVAIVQALLDRHATQLSVSLPAAAAGDCLIMAKALVEADAGRSAVPPPDLEGRIARAIYGYLTVDAPGDRLALHSAHQPLSNRARRNAAKAATGAARRRGHAA